MAVQKRDDFSQGGIAGNILSLAIPLTVAQLTVVLYNVVDRAFIGHIDAVGRDAFTRSEEHTSELQSLVVISYAVFCLKKIFF